MELKLPQIVASKVQLIKLIREVEDQINERTQKQITEEQTGDLREVANPSRSLKQLFELNDLEINDRNLEKVRDQLRELRAKAPVIKVSFADEPDLKITEQLVDWFRKEISPNVLIQVGIQPMIAGGMMLRTPSKVFDFSLRQFLMNNRDKLSEALHNVG